MHVGITSRRKRRVILRRGRIGTQEDGKRRDKEEAEDGRDEDPVGEEAAEAESTQA